MKQMSRISLAAALAVGLVVGGIMLLPSVAGESDPSTADVIEGPSVGPSGQTDEDMTWLDNTGEPWDGEADSHGPYRLIPPGTQYIEREYPEELSDAPVTVERGRAETPASPLVLDVPADRTELRFSAHVQEDAVIEATHTWSGDGGAEVAVWTRAVPEPLLPIDIYRTLPDSLTTVETGEIDGQPAIFDMPNSGGEGSVPPPPPGGAVRVWLDGTELVIQSDTEDVEALVDLAKELASALG